jgi:hypothetical protein
MEDCIVDAVDNEQHALTKKQVAEQMAKHLLLVFPKFVKLSVKEINDDDEDEEDDSNNDRTALVPVPVTNEYEVDVDKQNIRHFIVWKVCRLDLKPHKKGKVEKKTGRLQSLFENHERERIRKLAMGREEPDYHMSL